MVEQVIVFAAGHKRKASEIGEHGPIAILPGKRAAVYVLARAGG
jgi:hypothetical protein